MGLKKIWVTKNVGSEKKFGVKKNVGTKKTFGKNTCATIRYFALLL